MDAQRTQITRTSVSRPTRFIAGRFNEKLTGLRILHHGSGKAYADTALLEELGATVTDYEPNPADDPAKADRKRLKGTYDLVISNYVLNVLPPEQRDEVWGDLYSIARLAQRRRKDVVIYVTVRSFRDTSIKGQPFEDGVITSRGTFQKGYDEQELHREADRYFEFSHVINNSDTGITLALGRPV